MAKAFVLVVEDNPMSRATAVEIFEDLGFAVLDTYNGHHALALLEARLEIGLLFIDVRMPGMSGPELGRGATAASRYQGCSDLRLCRRGGRAEGLHLCAEAVAHGPSRTSFRPAGRQLEHSRIGPALETALVVPQPARGSSERAHGNWSMPF